MDSYQIKVNSFCLSTIPLGGSTRPSSLKFQNCDIYADHTRRFTLNGAPLDYKPYRACDDTAKCLTMPTSGEPRDFYLADCDLSGSNANYQLWHHVGNGANLRSAADGFCLDNAEGDFRGFRCHNQNGNQKVTVVAAADGSGGSSGAFLLQSGLSFCMQNDVASVGSNTVNTITQGTCTTSNTAQWFVNADPLPGGVSGDPHFKTWSGRTYDFHGHCDLVLLHAPRFGSSLHDGTTNTNSDEDDESNKNKTGLSIHIRSSPFQEILSYVSATAMRIGNDIVEVRSSGEHYVNGVRQTIGSTSSIAGYLIRSSVNGKGRYIYRIILHNNDKHQQIGGQRIIIREMKSCIHVNIVHTSAKDL